MFPFQKIYVFQKIADLKRSKIRSFVLWGSRSKSCNFRKGVHPLYLKLLTWWAYAQGVSLPYPERWSIRSEYSWLCLLADTYMSPSGRLYVSALQAFQRMRYRMRPPCVGRLTSWAVPFSSSKFPNSEDPALPAKLQVAFPPLSCYPKCSRDPHPGFFF